METVLFAHNSYNRNGIPSIGRLPQLVHTLMFRDNMHKNYAKLFHPKLLNEIRGGGDRTTHVDRRFCISR